MHQQIRPHKCEQCDKGFVTAYDLKIHSQTHTGAHVHNVDFSVIRKESESVPQKG